MDIAVSIQRKVQYC